MNMKVLAIIFIIGLFLIFTIFYISLPKRDALKLLDEMYEKRSKIEKYSLNYSIARRSSWDNISTEIIGSANEILIGKTSRIIAELASQRSLNEKYESLFYSIPEGNIECIKSFSIVEPEYTCIEVESKNIIGWGFPKKFHADLLKSWTNKGIVTVLLEGTRKIIGRECYNFRFDVNPEKLAMETKDTIYLKDARINGTIFQCLDKELGLPLSIRWVLRVNITNITKQYDIYEEINVNALSLNVGIDKIELPVPVEKVKWIPKFDILETLCRSNLNEVKVVVKARKDISGKAILNLIERGGKIKLTSELDLVKIPKSEMKTLNFHIPLYLKEGKYYLVNLTIADSTSLSACLT